MQRQTAAYIDLDAMRANLALATSLAPSSRILAVIKADAYGHGILEVARALGDAVPMFGVATVDEAITLRDGGIDNEILVLEGVMSQDACEEAAARDIVTMLHSAEQVELLKDTGISAWVKVDTGMHRLGIDAVKLPAVVAELEASGVAIQAVCTHLACAEETDNPMTDDHLAIFANAMKDLDLPRSIANSAALTAWPNSHADWNRPGLMLYGVSPFDEDLDAVASDLPYAEKIRRARTIQWTSRGL